jgi:GNAT superfamily N-acetyltransferase
MSRGGPTGRDPEPALETFAPGAAIDPGLWRAVEEIFFLSAGPRDFATPEDRREFLERWTGYYRACEPEGILLALGRSGRVAGYLTGCRDSRGALRLYRDIPYFDLFEDYFEAFPAHFHINCHPRYRNKGIGTRLVTAYLERCADQGLPGVHVVTAAAARNVVFYRRCGFAVSVTRRWRGEDLMLLAARL